MINKKNRIIVVSVMISSLACLLITISPAFAGGSNNPSPFGAGDQPATAKEYYLEAGKADSNKDYAEAVRNYTEAIRLDPHYGEAYGNRGAAKFNLKDFPGALNDYNQALRIFPNNKALLDLRAQVEGVMRANANQRSEASAQNNAARLNQAILGGDLADPSTIIMMNAQRRGLVPADSGDLSDPANIIMMNARRRGLIPQNTPAIP